MFSSAVPQDTRLDTKSAFTKAKTDKLDFYIWKGKRVPGLQATHKNTGWYHCIYLSLKFSKNVISCNIQKQKLVSPKD